MPFPNFHACRLNDPKAFEQGSFRSITLKGTKGVRLIVGKLKGKSTTTNQSYRFPKKAYTVEQAKAWAKSQKAKCVEFEPAGEAKGGEIVNAPAIALFDLSKQIENEGGTIELARVLSECFSDQETAEGCSLQEDESEDGSEEEGDGTAVEFTTDPDTATGETSVEKTKYEILVPITKIIAKKRTIYGVVYAPEEPDAHNHFMTAETIEVAAHRFMAVSRKIDEMHDYEKGAGVPVESFIVREGDKDFVWDEGPNKGKAKIGAWVLGTKIISDEVWKRVLKGEYKAYSLAGMAEYGKEKEMLSRWYDDKGNRQDPYGDDKKDKK